MMENAADVLPSDNDAGLTKVLREDYAFLMESSSIEYIVERYCNVTQIGGLLDAKGYGIAMKKRKFLSFRSFHRKLKIKKKNSRLAVSPFVEHCRVKAAAKRPDHGTEEEMVDAETRGWNMSSTYIDRRFSMKLGKKGRELKLYIDSVCNDARRKTVVRAKRRNWISIMWVVCSWY